MKTILLNISDIHISSENRPANEGVVLNSFIEDVRTQIQRIEHDECYVLIGGDLVFAASDKSYEKFDEEIIQKLMKVLDIDRKHFFIVPGNHDINQSFIGEVEESFISIFNKKYGEDIFNEVIRKEAQYSILFDKFNAYKKYMTTTMERNDYSLLYNYYAIDNIWSVYCLNTAILSCGGYKGIDDQGHLGVDTHGLYEMISKDSCPKKILLMHHPDYFCMDWVKHELRKMYGTNFCLVLSGHTHDHQESLCSKGPENNYIHCEAPQLFTNKNDNELGYSFIEIINDKVSRIIYREWLEKRNRFRPGSAFTDDESGIESFLEGDIRIEDEPRTDNILLLLEERLHNEMKAFVNQPYIWVDRYLSDDRIDQLFRLHKSSLFSETDIINNQENIRIVAPSQYGLSCYGSHFLITLWKTKHEFGIKIDADGVRTHRFEGLVQEELNKYNMSPIDVKWIVIDNWRPYKKDQKGISLFLKQTFSHSHIIFMSPYHEVNFCDHLNAIEQIEISKTLYLTPLKHEQERLIIDAYNQQKYIEDSDVILDKLDDDIKTFNLHRTPYSCITLLTVFKDSFDRNPINRTSVLENILHIIFDNTKLPTYKTTNPDVKDCEFCMGYFCSKLIDKEYYFFSRDDFYSSLREFCTLKEYDININQLFDILCFNRIIIESNGAYTFHFTFWVYYFVASWMHYDNVFTHDMLTNKKYLHYPEVLEFYTGKDRKRIDAVEIITNDLSQASLAVQKKTGIPNDVNLFSNIRYNNNKEQNEVIIREIENHVQESNLPQKIKDQTADLTFNPSSAFHQDIYKVYSDFSVGYLVNCITISCKVLRNSDQLDAIYKKKLLNEITQALKVFSNIIYLVSPLFAKQGYIQLPEYGFKLTEDFETLDEKECMIRIIASIPYNLTIMFKNDIFSSKLGPVYLSQIKEEQDKIKKHFLAALIVYKQPEGWYDTMLSYINSLGKESYYLGTIIELMTGVFYLGDLEESDKTKMKLLIKSAVYKAETGNMPPSLKAIWHHSMPLIEDVQGNTH